MSDSFEMRPIARIRSDFGSKFGVPRQSGLVDALEAAVVFEEPYRNPDALRGWRILPHLADLGLSPVPAAGMVPHSPAAPAGGNQRVGVFASRPPSGPIPSASPPCGWTTSRTRTPWARCSMSVAQTW